ncbi:hypothetical protein niasHT_021427 [Heterodera trifolii]|uniref:Uncharacterized protein n=1 Tax=Heterodera trifolii TaxID=157864 RepID=A0ABD2K375_9BILA
MSDSGNEAKRKRKEWRRNLGRSVGSTQKTLKQTEAETTADGEGTSTQAAESGPSTSALDLRPRSSPTPLSATPIRRHVRVRAKTADKGTHMDFTTADKGTHMDFTTMDKATDMYLAYEDAATQTEQLDKQLKEQEEAIGFLRQQVRNRDAMITALRRQLEEKMAPPMETLTTSKTTPTGRPKMNADHLQRTSRRKLADQIADVTNRDRSRSASRASLERISREVRHKFAHYTPKKKKQQQPRQNDSVDPEDALLITRTAGRMCRNCSTLFSEIRRAEGAISQSHCHRMTGCERMRGFLSKKPKAHLLLSHFVPFAREHKFLGLLDEQGDEALHSVWRRLEQLWKCMPDADQILQQLEHHFVNNWLLDTGKIDEMKQRQSDQREENDEFDQSEEETDEISLINVID